MRCKACNKMVHHIVRLDSVRVEFDWLCVQCKNKTNEANLDLFDNLGLSCYTIGIDNGEDYFESGEKVSSLY